MGAGGHESLRKIEREARKLERRLARERKRRQRKAQTAAPSPTGGG
jgi:hypothetical protein